MNIVFLYIHVDDRFCAPFLPSPNDINQTCKCPITKLAGHALVAWANSEIVGLSHFLTSAHKIK